MQLKRMGYDIEFNSLKDRELADFIDTSCLKQGCFVTYSTSFEYDNTCGSIGLWGKSKEDGMKYALNAGKSSNLGLEIRKFIRIISSPEKQRKEFDYSRWYDISNLYCDFEIEVLCKNVSEKEALKTEAAWAIFNNAQFKFKIENETKVKIYKSHGYWM